MRIPIPAALVAAALLSACQTVPAAPPSPAAEVAQPAQQAAPCAPAAAMVDRLRRQYGETPRVAGVDARGRPVIWFGSDDGDRSWTLIVIARPGLACAMAAGDRLGHCRRAGGRRRRRRLSTTSGERHHMTDDRDSRLDQVARDAREARQMASSALTKIDAHNDHCAERWAEARDAMRGLRSEVRGIKGHAWTMAIAIITGLAGAAGFLFWAGFIDRAAGGGP